MNVLVTGATGFLGRHLCAALVERGDAVRAFVRPGTDAGALEALGVEVVRGSLADAGALRAAAAGRALVFNAVGLVSYEWRQLDRLREANVESVRRVLAAVEPGARLVHVSSGAAVGPSGSPDRLADEAQPFPEVARRNPYSVTKHDAEELVFAAVAGGLDAVVGNPAIVLGPGDVYGSSTWPVRRYLQGTLRFHTRGGGASFVDVRDAAAGLVALAERGRTGERYILTCREGNLPWNVFFRRVGAATGVRRVMLPLPPPVLRAAVRVVPWPVKPGEARTATEWWIFDPGKAERELGFTTRPLAETIRDTAADGR
ncbi:MAG TPA: NAD-dependent epimerase/dehydratase family protein [Gaiellaceae bacterium]|nr:NAD-dependent epimerase/dehydratase family protein [Gaiellaceae bacterium]